MPEKFVCHSVPQVLSGALLLWVGWYGFNPGSTGQMSTVEDGRLASNAAMTTTIGGATAGCVALIYDLVISEGQHIEIHKFVNSILGGLVSVTAGADTLTPWTSILTGIVAFAVCQSAEQQIVAHRIDDVVSAIPVHGACGAWGCIAVGLFKPSGGLFYGYGFWLLGTQIVGVITIFLLGFVPIYGLCKLLHLYGYLRASEEEEAMGLDQYLFKECAYADEPEDTSNNSFSYSIADPGAGAQAGADTLPARMATMGRRISAYVEADVLEALAENGDSEEFPKRRRSSLSDLVEGAGPAPELMMPPLTEVITMLKNELEMPKETTMAMVIKQACIDFEVNLPGSSVTLQAKAIACWKKIIIGRDYLPPRHVPAVRHGARGGLG